MAQLLYAAIITFFILISRALIIFIGGSFFDGAYLGGILVSALPHFFFVYLFSLFLLPSTTTEATKETKKKKKKQEVQIIDFPKGQVIAVTTLMTFYYFSLLMTFFYESVFTNLPSKGIFFYLGQLKHMSSSLGANAPVFIILILMILFYALSWVSRKKLVNYNKPLPLKNSWLIPILLIASLTLHTASGSFSGKIFSGSRHSYLHLIGQFFDKSQDTNVISASTDFTKIHEFQKDLGQIPPRGALKEGAPFCEDREMDTEVKTPRSVIVLIVEGLGIEHLNKKINGRFILPNFQKVLSRNLTFTKFLAAGSKSSNALPALFSGLPPQPHTNILWVVPPPRVRGVPNILSASGYKTSYFHGSDLSFEHQREFLQRIGFNEIYEYDPNLPHERLGWGYSDGVMYDKLKSWIQKNQGTPYFTSLFTLSTHDPYVLPQSWKPVFVKENKTLKEGDDWFAIWKDNDEGKRMAAWESYVYADTEFKKFYDWYEKNEKHKGTILVVVGDHYPYYIERGKDDHNRFLVPLSFIGLSKEEILKYKDFIKRRGTQYDLPSTLAEFLGYKPHPCDQGLNLFSPVNKWPKDRIIYAIGGESHEKMYVWKNRGQAFFNKSKKKLSLISTEQFGLLKSDEYRPFLMDIKRFIEVMSPLQAFAINNNAFFPPDRIDKPKRASLSESETPLYVSHRGNTEGPGTPANENSLKALEKVLASPFKWVELDIQITSDGIPILAHDPTFKVGGAHHWVFRYSLAELKKFNQFRNVLTLEEVLKKYSGKLNFLIEGKKQEHVSPTHQMGRNIAKLVREYKSKTAIIVDSFDSHLIASIKRYCDCDTGWDTPFQQKVTDDMLNFALEMNMNWIYVHHKVFNTDLMKRAHAKGLKVMVYTANQDSDLEASSIKPDGIITDTKNMIKN